MEIIKKYEIMNLTECTVNVILNNYILIEGVETKLGDTTSVCYNNIPYDRDRMQEVLPENILNAIFAMWGNEPAAENPPVIINSSSND